MFVFVVLIVSLFVAILHRLPLINVYLFLWYVFMSWCVFNRIIICSAINGEMEENCPRIYHNLVSVCVFVEYSGNIAGLSLKRFE